MDYHKLAHRIYGTSGFNGTPGFREVPKTRQLESAISDLWRSYPEHQCTVSSCYNDACESGQPGRGGGLCSSCVVGCIGAILGSPELAEEYNQAVLACRRVKRQMLKTLEIPLYFNWTVKCLRNGAEDTTYYTAAHSTPVSAEHVRLAPSVRAWLRDGELLSIEPGAPNEH